MSAEDTGAYKRAQLITVKWCPWRILEVQDTHRRNWDEQYFQLRCVFVPTQHRAHIMTHHERNCASLNSILYPKIGLVMIIHLLWVSTLSKSPRSNRSSLIYSTSASLSLDLPIPSSGHLRSVAKMRSEGRKGKARSGNFQEGR